MSSWPLDQLQPEEHCEPAQCLRLDQNEDYVAKYYNQVRELQEDLFRERTRNVEQSMVFATLQQRIRELEACQREARLHQQAMELHLMEQVLDLRHSNWQYSRQAFESDHRSDILLNRLAMYRACTLPSTSPTGHSLQRCNEQEMGARLVQQLAAVEKALVEFLSCPIAGSLFADPVVGPDGQTYERVPLRMWLQEHNSSPLTRQPMQSAHLWPNHLVRQVVELLCQHWPQNEVPAATLEQLPNVEEQVTAFVSAFLEGRLETVYYMLTLPLHSESINWVDDSNRTLLVLSIIRRLPALSLELLTRDDFQGAAITSDSGWSALHHAAAFRYRDVCQRIVARAPETLDQRIPTSSAATINGRRFRFARDSLAADTARTVGDEGLARALTRR